MSSSTASSSIGDASTPTHRQPKRLATPIENESTKKQRNDGNINTSSIATCDFASAVYLEDTTARETQQQDLPRSGQNGSDEEDNTDISIEKEEKSIEPVKHSFRAQKRKIHGGYADAPTLDRRLTEWVGHGHSNEEISKQWLAATGEVRGGRSLRSRTSRIVKQDLTRFTATDEQILADVKAGVFEKYENKRWSMVADEFQRLAQSRSTTFQSSFSAAAVKERYGRIQDPSTNRDLTLTEAQTVTAKEIDLLVVRAEYRVRFMKWWSLANAIVAAGGGQYCGEAVRRRVLETSSTKF
ncbi:hypothetical protein MMC16_007530 [Acarospora aff. strigata]|nr:hypothetical protein [Acarospora aff. strigata]